MNELQNETTFYSKKDAAFPVVSFWYAFQKIDSFLYDITYINPTWLTWQEGGYQQWP